MSATWWTLVLGLALGCSPAKTAVRAEKAVKLQQVLGQLAKPVDIQAVPGQPGLMVVAEKGGRALWFEPATGAKGPWLKITPQTRSEQGLLGVAFHPQFATNGRFFLHYSTLSAGRQVGRIEAWVHRGADPRKGVARARYVVLEVEQPYANHNGGQITFGPDGMLYIGFGDGGAANDPHGNSQNLETLLGAVLRIDVDGAKPYAIPKDNPRVGKSGRPELWAWGLRNPWRFSFAPDGRIVVGDVGQNRLEEISFVPKGANLGWNIREANMCFKPRTGCTTDGLLDPIYQYRRSQGVSVTGGVVAASPPSLKGRYIFGDFVTGQLWSLQLPETGSTAKARSLGRLGINPTAFGHDDAGRLYVVDFAGQVLRVIESE